MMFSGFSSNSKLLRLARAFRNTGKENGTNNLAFNAPHAGRSIEHTWPTFASAPSDAQFVRPIQENALASFSTTSTASPLYQTKVKRLSVTSIYGHLTDTTNVDEDICVDYEYSDEEKWEFEFMYATRFSALKKPKLSRSSLKRKLKVIRKVSRMKGPERFRTDHGMHGASHLRYTDVPSKKEINNASVFNIKKFGAKLNSITRARDSSLNATRRLVGSIKESLRKRTTSRSVSPQNRTPESSPALDESSARAISNLIHNDHQNIDRFRLEPTPSLSQSVMSLNNTIPFPTIPDESEFAILAEFPLPPTFERWL